MLGFRASVGPGVRECWVSLSYDGSRLRVLGMNYVDTIMTSICDTVTLGVIPIYV